MTAGTFKSIQDAINRCDICKQTLPLAPRPILSIHPSAKILIAGQAPGLITHKQNMPFKDKSGERLRDWMGMTEQQFYAKQDVAIVPMAFCYPGKGDSGDLPPPKICAQTWRKQVMGVMKNIKLHVLIGSYSIDWYSKYYDDFNKHKTLTETVKQSHKASMQGKQHWFIPLPHPSPRNNIWLKKNSWFEKEVVPSLQKRVKQILAIDN